MADVEESTAPAEIQSRHVVYCGGKFTYEWTTPLSWF